MLKKSLISGDIITTIGEGDFVYIADGRGNRFLKLNAHHNLFDSYLYPKFYDNKLKAIDRKGSYLDVVRIWRCKDPFDIIRAIRRYNPLATQPEGYKVLWEEPGKFFEDMSWEIVSPG